MAGFLRKGTGMADYDSPQKTKKQYVPRAGEMAVAFGVAEITSPLGVADFINYCTLPAGAEVLGGWVRGPQLDTGATLVVDIGYSGAAAKYYSGYTGMQSATYFDNLKGDLDDPTNGGVLAALGSDTLIRADVTTGAGGMTGTPVTALVIQYTRSIT